MKLLSLPREWELVFDSNVAVSGSVSVSVEIKTETKSEKEKEIEEENETVLDAQSSLIGS